MKRQDNKSRCPVNFSLETFGDSWSMLIIRDMAVIGKQTFSEFLRSEEAIGPSVLANRLEHLEQKGIIQKRPAADDKRKIIYTLTPRGINAIPVLYALSVWGTEESSNPKTTQAWLQAMKLDKDLVITTWCQALSRDSSFFTGPNSVVKSLGL